MDDTKAEREFRMEVPDPAMARLYSAMTSEQRLAVVFDLMQFTHGLVKASIRDAHPEWTDEQVRREYITRTYGRVA